MRYEISGWKMDEKLVSMPSDISIRLAKIGWVLDLEKTDVDMIPRGLKGIDAVSFGYIKGPIFIAPDFQGKVFYLKKKDPSIIDMEMMSQKDVENAKFRYLKYKNFVEAPRVLLRAIDGWEKLHPYGFVCVLPNKMSFYVKDRKKYLDLSKTSIEQYPTITGVDEIIMPDERMCIHKKIQPKKTYKIRDL